MLYSHLEHLVHEDPVRIRSTLSEHGCVLIRRGFDYGKLLAELEAVSSQLTTSGGILGFDVMPLSLINESTRLVSDGNEIVSRVLAGSSWKLHPVAFARSTCGVDKPVPAHQDRQRWDQRGNLYTVWLALSDANTETATGIQLWLPCLWRPVKQPVAEEIKKYFVPWTPTLHAGDIVVFDGWLLHGTASSPEKTQRRLSVDVRLEKVPAWQPVEPVRFWPKVPY